jgi:hypothetical protein
MFIIFGILLIFSLLLESTVTTVPLVLVCLICLLIIKRNEVVFLYAFLAGLFLDIFAVRNLGISSGFFLFILFLMFLYQRKYEINSFPFLIIVSYLGSLFFLLLFGFEIIFIQAGISSIFAVILFSIFRIKNISPKI